MTAIVMLNLIGAVLIVTAIVSLLAWAIIRERDDHPTARQARVRPAVGPSRPRAQPQPARTALDLQ